VKRREPRVQLAEQGLLLVSWFVCVSNEPSVARNTWRLAPRALRASITLAIASSCCEKLFVSPMKRADRVASVVVKKGFRMALLVKRAVHDSLRRLRKIDGLIDV